MTKDNAVVNCFEISQLPTINRNLTHEQIVGFYASAQSVWAAANMRLTQELKKADIAIKELKNIPEDSTHKTANFRDRVDEIVGKLDSNLYGCDQKIREFRKKEEDNNEKGDVITVEEYLEALDLSFDLMNADIFLAQLSAVEPIVTTMKRIAISKEIMKKKGYAVM